MSHSLACFYLRWEVCSGERARSLCSHAGVSCEKGIFQAGAKVSCLAGSAWERAYAGIILGSGVRLTYGLCRVPTDAINTISSPPPIVYQPHPPWHPMYADHAPLVSTIRADYHAAANVRATSNEAEAANIHGVDESVSLKSLRDVTATMMALLIRDWCGLVRVGD